MKFLALALIFLGELIGIYFEISLSSRLRSSDFGNVSKALLIFSPGLLLGIIVLVLGYIYGYKSFNKIWIVTIISWSSIIIIEPILNYFIFNELPEGRTLIGGALAIAAILVSIF